jgi:ABC-type glycerol-3-phosphate transport system permease component
VAKKLFILAILIFGGIIFALPFLDMVFTSMKTDDEIAEEHYHLVPRTPRAQQASPYAMLADDMDKRIERPADMDKGLWALLAKPYENAIREVVTAWWDNGGSLNAGGEGTTFFKANYAGVDRTQAIDTLTQTVGGAVMKRVSDKVRKETAAKVEEGKTEKGKTEEGIALFVSEAKSLANDETIWPEFKVDVPRFSVGEVRVRVADFSRRLAGRGENWTVVSGPATLAASVKPFDAGTQVNYNFGAGGNEITLRMTPPVGGTGAGGAAPLDAANEAAGINRVNVSFQPDRSWGRIELFVIRDGKRFQMKEPLYSDDVRWTEVELRWPNPAKDVLSGRSYRLLDPADAQARDAGVAFAVEMRVTPVGAFGAWWAKSSRNYTLAFIQAPLWRYLMTSFSLAILNIILVVFSSSLAAYSFARCDFPGRNVLFAVLLATMMIPGQVTMIPSFLIWKNLGGYNTLLPLWVPSAFGTAFFIFMARQFLKSIPKELEEAARIDGCGFFRIYWHIMLPLIRPTLAAIAMFAFQGAWNNFMGPLIYVNDERLFPLAFGLWKFNLQSGASNSLMMAGAFVMTLPLIITFFLFQRYFVQGISLSGLGGR